MRLNAAQPTSVIVIAADGDSVSIAKVRRCLAAALCKRLQELLVCLRVLVTTIIAMPAVIDMQVCACQLSKGAATACATHACMLSCLHYPAIHPFFGNSKLTKHRASVRPVC